MAVKKYTAEQVSRILSAAANGQLGLPSDHGNTVPRFCIEQIASDGALDSKDADDWNSERMDAYDNAMTTWYEPPEFASNPDATLRWLEQQGMV